MGWDGTPEREPRLGMREAFRIRRAERKENPEQPDPFGHLRFPRLVQYVTDFKGGPVALACAATGIIATVAVVALGVSGALAGVRLDGDLEVVGALIAFVSGVVAGDILLRRHPWRGPLSIAATAASRRPPGTLGLSYHLPGDAVFTAKHRLLAAGFDYVATYWHPTNGPDASGQIEALIRINDERGITHDEAKRRAEEVLDGLGVPYREIGSSQS